MLADTLTVLLGGLALYGLIAKRKKIATLVNVVLNSQLNERVRRIRGTLTQLENISLDDKTRYKECMALLGQLSGQLKPFAASRPKLQAPHADLVFMLEGKKHVQEHRKNAVTHEISGLLDELSADEYLGLFSEGDKK